MSKKVSLLLDREDGYQASLAKEAAERAARRGLGFDGPHYADDSAVTQMEQLLATTKADPRPDGVLLLTSGRESQLPACRRVVKAGLSLVFLNRPPEYLEELRSANGEVLVAVVAPDQAEIGRIQAAQCRKLLPDGGFVVLITGNATHASAIARRDGFTEGVAGSGIEVRVLEAQWTEDSAHRALSDFYRFGAGGVKPIHAIVCQNDQMAPGARRALVDHGGDAARVPLLGCDGLVDEGQRLVAQGQLAGTIIMPSTAGRAIDLLATFWEDGTRADVVQLPPTAFPRLAAMKVG